MILKITDAENKRYEVPLKFNKTQRLPDHTHSIAKFETSIDKNTGLFSFSIFRRDNKEKM